MSKTQPPNDTVVEEFNERSCGSVLHPDDGEGYDEARRFRSEKPGA